MDKSSHRFFIALLPPQDIQDEVTQLKQYFADNYQSRAALKSPPHITLQPPFEWPDENVPLLEECLSQFANYHAPVPVTLLGFGAFPPHVIYVDVIKSPALLTVQGELMKHLKSQLGISDPKSKGRSYTPHMTVAFQDLKPQQFKAAWPKFQERSLYHNFTAYQLTLLIHNGQQWNISAEFPFPDNSPGTELPGGVAI